MRLAVSNIEGFSPVKVARDCSMSAVELAFHFYVTPRWLLGGKKKIECRPGFTTEEQFSKTTLLWESGDRCRPVSQQECILEFIHISLFSQYEEAALEAFGPSIR